MGRLIALLLGGFGLGAYLRRRRRHSEPDYSPADELRSKLAQTRTAEEVAAPEQGLESELEERRREVHERARGAIDDLS